MKRIHNVGSTGNRLIMVIGLGRLPTRSRLNLKNKGVARTQTRAKQPMRIATTRQQHSHINGRDTVEKIYLQNMYTSTKQ